VFQILCGAGGGNSPTPWLYNALKSSDQIVCGYVGILTIIYAIFIIVTIIDGISGIAGVVAGFPAKASIRIFDEAPTIYNSSKSFVAKSKKYSTHKHVSVVVSAVMRVFDLGTDTPLIVGQISIECLPDVEFTCAEKKTLYVPVVGISTCVAGYAFPDNPVTPIGPVPSE
jgi:hypothetical protein